MWFDDEITSICAKLSIRINLRFLDEYQVIDGEGEINLIFVNNKFNTEVL